MRKLKIVPNNQQQPAILEIRAAGDDGGNFDEHFAEDQLSTFLYAISRGYTIKHACNLCGLKEQRVYAWLNPSHKQHRPKFRKLFDRAKAIEFGRHLEEINRSGDWRAHAFWLERRTDEFKVRSPEQVDVSPGSSDDGIVMTPETIKALSEAYDTRLGKNEDNKNEDKKSA